MGFSSNGWSLMSTQDSMFRPATEGGCTKRPAEHLKGGITTTGDVHGF